MMHRYLFLLLPLLALTACAPKREEADSKLAAACEASIRETFSDPKDHIAIQNTSFSFEKIYEETRVRVVTLKAQYTYGDSQPEDKTYACTYTEEWSLSSYQPEFYNLVRDDQKYGNFSGNILGDADVLARIKAVTQKNLK